MKLLLSFKLTSLSPFLLPELEPLATSGLDFLIWNGSSVDRECDSVDFWDLVLFYVDTVNRFTAACLSCRGAKSSLFFSFLFMSSSPPLPIRPSAGGSTGPHEPGPAPGLLL